MMSSDLCAQVIAWRYKDHRAVSEISDLAGCSQTTIFKILRFHYLYAQPNNPFAWPQSPWLGIMI